MGPTQIRYTGNGLHLPCDPSGCERLADELIPWVQQTVAWWEGNVRGKGEKRNNAGRGYFVDDAERRLKVKQQQISRWKKELADG